jgi:putative transposase
MDMKPSRFTEEQIIGILREHEAEAKTADVCRKHGISSASFRFEDLPTGHRLLDAPPLRGMTIVGSGNRRNSCFADTSAFLRIFKRECTAFGSRQAEIRFAQTRDLSAQFRRKLIRFDIAAAI